MKNSILAAVRTHPDRGSSNEGGSSRDRSRKSSIKPGQFEKRKSSVMSGSSLKSRGSGRRASSRFSAK